MKLKRYIDMAIRRQLRRLLDAPDDASLSKIHGIMNRISSSIYQLYLPVGYVKTAWDNSTALKQAERAADNVFPACKNGQFDRALRLIDAIKNTLMREDAEDAKCVGGGTIIDNLNLVKSMIRGN